MLIVFCMLLAKCVTHIGWRRCRIIIKHKKLMQGATEVEKSGHQEAADISSSYVYQNHW